MPLGAKLVIGWVIVALVLTFASLFTRMTPAAADVVSIVVQIALLTGLYTQRHGALRVGSQVSASSSALSSSCSPCFASNTTPAIAASAVATLALASGFFYLLGRDDSRAYFNAPRKA
jgi:hypothetical protein